MDKHEALDDVLLLFWKFGYQATKLPDLLQATGMSRGTFYRTFGDKREAYIAALRHYGETRITPALAAMNDDPRDPPEIRLQQLFEFTEPVSTTDSAANIGCFICNAMVEIAPFDEAVAEECQKLSEILTCELKTILQEVSGFENPNKAAMHAKLLTRLYFGSHANARIGATFGLWTEFIQGFLQTNSDRP